MTTNELKALLNEFLNRWTLQDVQNLTLQEYVGVGNKDTFCQWVETKTRILGSIKGLTSIKFGIYERKDKTKLPKNYFNDEEYSWLRGYGNDRDTAFENVKQDVLKIIRLAEIGKFVEIDKILLPDLYKWKVAFLYSNERLIPIFKREVLLKIANHYGLKTNRNTTISEIQDVMMLNKPAHLNVFAFMRHLFNQFGDNEDKKEIASKPQPTRKVRIKRRASTERNVESQIRTVSRSYLAEQKHNKIQEKLVELLKKEFGKDNVILEENYVDIKLIQPDYITFYEVKSGSYASNCIKDALGQILLYSANDEDKRAKKHIVVGQYPATINDEKYINFLKENLNLEFDYLSINID